MAPTSDEDYAAFLDRANADASGSASATGASNGGGPQGFTSSSVNAEVPPVLSQVEADYTSESDERFEPVSLAFLGVAARSEGGGNIGIGDFKQLCGHRDVEALNLEQFDPRDEYSSVVDAVKKAGNDKVDVFRVSLGGARCEYWIVSVDEKARKLVGLRAGAVES